jgi:KDO2-lipid IV(A) lauroyltransferase
MLRLPAIPLDGWMERVSFPEEEQAGLRAAYARGRGGVIVTGHFGCIEAAALTVRALGMPLAAYYQRMSNPLVDAAIARAREGVGLRLIDRRQGVTPGVEALHRGELVAVVADQDARTHGVFVPFFGRLASTHRGAAIMALRAGAPIFFGYVRRAPGGYVAGIRELEVARGGSTDDVVHAMTAAFTAALEATVRQAPEQYFWQHRRWKSSPETVVPEQAAAGAV